MRINYFMTGLFLLATAAMTSCGGSGASSSSDCFGGIPEMLASYEQESDELQGKSEETKELKEKTTAEVEKAATELNGKEISCAVDEAQLKVEAPVTLAYESMNNVRPVFRFGGKVVASNDLTLKADPSDLAGEELLSGAQVVISVKMPVAVDFLDKDGNVIHHINDIGTLEAANDGTTAVVKAGTPIDFCRTFTVDDKMGGVASIRLSVELDKAPYTSRSLR